MVCKPKIIYPSSATNWANDAYRSRLDFPEEHEIKGSGEEELSRETLSDLVLIKDSCKQFMMMNIPADYLKCKDNSLCKEREVLRMVTMIKRMLTICIPLTNNLVKEIPNCMQDIALRCEKIVCALHSEQFTYLQEMYTSAESQVQMLYTMVEPLVPQYRPLDIQTSHGTWCGIQ